MRTLIYDIDSLVFCEAYKHQTEGIQWDAETSSPPEVDLEGAWKAVQENIQETFDLTRADRAVYCITAPNNFRKQVWPLYKAQRTSPRPLLVEPLRDKLRSWGTVVEYPTLEADDVCGILMTAPDGNPDDTLIVVSQDKDLQQIPGLHFNPMRPLLGITEVTPHEGFYFFMMQTLMGDTADGYPGLRGIGPKKAEKILGPSSESTPKMLWSAVIDAYHERGQTKKDALIQARVARILQYQDYNPETQKVKLWKPPK